MGKYYECQWIKKPFLEEVELLVIESQDELEGLEDVKGVPLLAILTRNISSNFFPLVFVNM